MQRDHTASRAARDQPRAQSIPRIQRRGTAQVNNSSIEGPAILAWRRLGTARTSSRTAPFHAFIGGGRTTSFRAVQTLSCSALLQSSFETFATRCCVTHRFPRLQSRCLPVCYGAWQDLRRTLRAAWRESAVHDSMHSQLRTALPPLSIRTGAQSGSRRPDPQKKTLATCPQRLSSRSGGRAARAEDNVTAPNHVWICIVQSMNRHRQKTAN